MSEIERKIIKWNGETFTWRSYNDISILIRDSGVYVNATKLGNDKKETRKYINGEKFDEICNLWMKTQFGKNQPNQEITAKYQLFKRFF